MSGDSPPFPAVAFGACRVLSRRAARLGIVIEPVRARLCKGPARRAADQSTRP